VSRPLRIGVDLGGSRLRIGAVHEDGGLAGPIVSSPSGLDFDHAALFEEVSAFRAGLATAPLAIGCGVAGVVHEGRLTLCDGLPCLVGQNLLALLESAAGAPAALENDARCFTLAEWRHGAARGARLVCGLTLGTGVGCGVLLDGKPYRGARSQAGEPWRMRLRGESLEWFVSGAGVVRGYRAAGGPDSADLDAPGVHARARAGDPAAIAAWLAFGDDLALLVEAVLALLDPDRIVVGGSLASAADLYRPALVARLEDDVRLLVPAQLGEAAGVIGAAELSPASAG
jgi:predicted NBD/HSP70 family sugar kinase